ncbi:MAG: AAA family ATPase, partial [Candidatus Gracilibacteria bacterium]
MSDALRLDTLGELQMPQFMVIGRSRFEPEGHKAADRPANLIRKDDKGRTWVRRGSINTLYEPDGKIICSFKTDHGMDLYTNNGKPEGRYGKRVFAEEDSLKTAVEYIKDRYDKGTRSIKTFIELAPDNLKLLVSEIIEKTYVFQAKLKGNCNDEIDVNMFVNSTTSSVNAFDRVLVAIPREAIAIVKEMDEYFHFEERDACDLLGIGGDVKGNFPEKKIELMGFLVGAGEAKEFKVRILNTQGGNDKDKLRFDEFGIPAKELEGGDITGIGIDDGDNFLLIGSGHNLYVYDYTIRPFKLIGKFSDDLVNFEGTLYADKEGNILIGNLDGSVTMISTDFTSFGKAKDREDARAANAQETMRMRKEEAERGRLIARKEALIKAREEARKNAGTTGAAEVEISGSAIVEDEDKSNLEEYKQKLDDARTIDDVAGIRREIKAHKDVARTIVADSATLDAMFKSLTEYVVKREAEIIMPELISEEARIKAEANGIDSMSLVRLLSFSNRVDAFRGNVRLYRIEKQTKTNMLDLCDEIDEKVKKVLVANEAKSMAEVDAVVEKVEKTLAGFTRLHEFEEWGDEEDGEFGAALDQIDALMTLAGIKQEALKEHCRKSLQKITRLRKECGKRFRQEREAVDAKAVEGIGTKVQSAELLIAELIEELSERVNDRGFENEEQIDICVDGHPMRKSIESFLLAIEKYDKEKAHSLSMKFRIGIAELKEQLRASVESRAEGSTGRAPVHFGSFPFLDVWDGKAEKLRVDIALDFKVDNATKGPGVNPNNYMCELVFKTKDKSGTVKEVPLNSDEVRKYGFFNPRLLGDLDFGKTHMTVREAKGIIAKVKDVNLGLNPDLQAKYDAFQARIQEMHTKIKDSEKQWAEADGPFPGIVEAAKLKGSGSIWHNLLLERKELTKEYHQFLNDEGLYVWQKMRNFKKSIIEGRGKNGLQGKVPKISNHWVIDEETDKVLEQFAEFATMQLEDQDGMISLEGHAGTGKDVVVSMFCAKTNRPKFTFDCSKWTTEFDMSQDLVLAAEGGASYTVKEDSVIVKALETPGAVLYFNEFNAMPRQAQIFLHSLLDEKRQITLKTSSGRIVKADPTVVICCSMNPGYPD